MAYEATEVPVERSQGEIRKLLHRYGAANFSFAEGNMDGVLWAMVEFMHDNERVRMQVPLKEPNRREAVNKANRSRTKTVDQIVDDMAEQEAKRIWRVMVHTLKARLVAVEERVETFHEAFLAHLVDPVTGRTLWDQAKTLIEAGAMKIGGQGMQVGPPALNPGLRVIEHDESEVLDTEAVE